MSYTLDNITLESKRTQSGVGYWQWGTGPNLVVYLHGIGERGNGSEADLIKLLNQGPLGRNGWLTYSWKFPDLFNRTDLKILYPQLPTSRGSWDINYIDQFLDEVHFGQPLLLMGWSLGGGGVCRYVNQVNPKHEVTMVVGLASAILERGLNVKVPYRFAHAQNDTTVNVSQTDNFVSGIPDFDSFRYERPANGGHWWPLNLCNPLEGIYDEFVSYAKPVNDIEGKLILRGDKVIGFFNGQEIVLK